MLTKRNSFNRKAKKFKRNIIRKLKKRKITIILILTIVFFLIATNIIYNKHINNEKNIIKTVNFDKNYIKNPNLKELIYFINDTLSGSNSAKNKILKYKSQKEKILNDSKILNDLSIQLLNNKSLKINLDFKKPKINFQGSGFIYSVYSENNIKKYDKNNLSGLKISLTGTNLIYLPSYLYGKNMDKIFFKDSLEKIKKYSKIIDKHFPKGKIYYLAGGENLKLETKEKTYIFSTLKKIENQINQLKIARNKYPKKLEKAKLIDLGNLNEGIYLKMNKKVGK